VDEEPAKSNGFTNDEAAKVAAGRKAEVERQVKAEAETASKKQPKRRFSVADVTDLVSETYKSETNYGVHSSNSKMDEVERVEINAKLRANFQQVLSASLAATPRLMRHSLDLALKFTIEPLAESNLIWLADLAVSLPVPAGWVQVFHPKEQLHYWYNEMTDSSRWQHPVDDFIKTHMKILRTPHHPSSLTARRVSLDLKNSQKPEGM